VSMGLLGCAVCMLENDFSLESMEQILHCVYIAYGIC